MSPQSIEELWFISRSHHQNYEKTNSVSSSRTNVKDTSTCSLCFSGPTDRVKETNHVVEWLSKPSTSACELFLTKTTDGVKTRNQPIMYSSLHAYLCAF